MQITDIKFIEENIINFESISLGFMRNIPVEQMMRYESIYKQYIDPSYILTYWCKSCVMDMMTRLKDYYEQNYC